MKIEEKNGMLEITTSVYQAKSGAIFINWGKHIIELNQEQAEVIAEDILEFDQKDYIKYYTNIIKI